MQKNSLLAVQFSFLLNDCLIVGRYDTAKYMTTPLFSLVFYTVLYSIEDDQ